MRYVKVGDYEIQTDDQTVWVNGPSGCVGRFQRSDSGLEFYSNSGMVDIKSTRDNLDVNWKQFCHDIKQLSAIEVPNDFKPEETFEQLIERHGFEQPYCAS